jgi:hypothetical protein
VPRVVGEVADLVDAEDGGLDVGAEASRARGRGLLPGKVSEQVARAAHEDLVASMEGAAREVFEEHRLGHTVGADDDDVRAFGDVAVREDILHQRAVDLLRPAPVEVAHGLEGTEAGDAGPVLEAAPGSLRGLDRDETGEPGLVLDFVEVSQAADQAQLLEGGLDLRRCRHRRLPGHRGAGRRSTERAGARSRRHARRG